MENFQKFIDIRREIHKNPEMGFHEFKTAHLVADTLRSLGVPEITEQVVHTGVVGTIYADNPQKTLLLRADMDALPIEETSNSTYKSQNPGVMHACGHDVHTSILLATAAILMNSRARLSCNVKLLFQPAEENLGGALPMIEAGVLENPHVDAALALHVWPSANTGEIILKNGPIMAAPDNFDIKIIGQSGHAAIPQEHTSPITLATRAATKIESLQMQFSEPVIIKVCKISSGTCYNIVPETCEFNGTIRTLSDVTRDIVPDEIERILAETTAKSGATYEANVTRFYPSTINDEKIIAHAARIAAPHATILWADQAAMVGEDFSYFTHRVPAAMLFLGCANKQKGIHSPLHSNTFDVDETCIPLGAKILSDFALQF